MGSLPQRNRTRLKGYDYNSPGTYFLTLCTENRRCILSRIVGTGVLDGPRMELLPYGEVAEKYIRQFDDFFENICVDGYTIMPNHIHILLTVKGREEPAAASRDTVVSHFVSTFKRFCNKEYGKNIWQYRSYDHIIRDQRDFDAHMKYISENPLGWEKDPLFSAE